MEYLSSGLAVTIIGITIVMIVLIMIAFAISLFKFIGTEKKEEQKPPVNAEPLPVLQPEAADDGEGEIVAAVMAAVSQYLQTDPSGFAVRSIKKVSGWEEISRLEKQV